MSARHHVHLQADVLAANPTDPSRKIKKANFFAVAISHPRKQEPVDERNGRSNGASTPQENTRAKRWSGRFRSGSGSSVGTQSTRASNERSGPSRDTPPPVPPKPGSSSQPKQPLRVVPPERQATYTSLNSPPPPYRFDDFENAVPEELDLDGRCSPLCGLPSPRLAQTTPAPTPSKGKERERAMSPLGRIREGIERQGKRQRDVEITHPKRVGSPQFRERERESRGGPTPVPVQVDKVASNTGSGNSKKSSATKESAGSTSAWAKRAKHGSFDFERPSSVTGGALNMRTALRGIGVTFETHQPQPLLERSRSTKEPPSRTHAAGKQPQSSSLPSSVGRTAARPSLDLNAPPMTRHPTESSQGGSSSAGRSYFNYGDSNPVSPISSNSGHSSSLGRKAGGRLQRGNLGPFKFEPAVPPIPGSPASDERTSRAARGPGDSPTPPPTRLREEHAASPPPLAKGRSLDLGLHLNWAPQTVREEALLPTMRPATGRAMPRWRGKVDEQGRLDEPSSRTAAEISRAFREALGDRAYATFKTYVHRFDAHAIPLEGPSGLVAAATRLLDTAGTLDERRKQVLIEKFVRFVQETQ
ncbi:hypothetical protein PsYK624_003130 [Phanerochaete sordida]|uniref:Uncharacterized protein n=1 Tax=Phanerochaete sordida TaxID=48140 RepID=A0A9P3L821_9APHY|nr:hypothetical protein PsYK624_003130 [Phanerochaete sordida]